MKIFRKLFQSGADLNHGNFFRETLCHPSDCGPFARSVGSFHQCCRIWTGWLILSFSPYPSHSLLWLSKQQQQQQLRRTLRIAPSHANRKPLHQGFPCEIHSRRGRPSSACCGETLEKAFLMVRKYFCFIVFCWQG